MHCKINRNIESSSTFILIKLRLLEIVVFKNSANIRRYSYKIVLRVNKIHKLFISLYSKLLYICYIINS